MGLKKAYKKRKKKNHGSDWRDKARIIQENTFKSHKNYSNNIKQISDNCNDKEKVELRKLLDMLNSYGATNGKIDKQKCYINDELHNTDKSYEDEYNKLGRLENEFKNICDKIDAFINKVENRIEEDKKQQIIKKQKTILIQKNQTAINISTNQSDQNSLDIDKKTNKDLIRESFDRLKKINFNNKDANDSELKNKFIGWAETLTNCSMAATYSKEDIDNALKLNQNDKAIKFIQSNKKIRDDILKTYKEIEDVYKKLNVKPENKPKKLQLN